MINLENMLALEFKGQKTIPRTLLVSDCRYQSMKGVVRIQRGLCEIAQNNFLKKKLIFRKSLKNK